MIVPKVAGLNCPNCGASVELRTFGQAITVTCPNCQSVLDAKDPNVAVLQQAQSAVRIEPVIPLGSRGLFSGVRFEAIGFQVRTTNDQDEDPDSWQEYLLYNPYHGYRYLTEYQGHWNLVRVANAIPEQTSGNHLRIADSVFSLYGRANAVTSYVIGEFPWQVRVGDSAQTADYISAPQILSSESTTEETVWSIGHYVSGAEVWQAFQLAGTAPAAHGVFANQPSPYLGAPTLWGTAWKLLAAAVVLALLLQSTSGKQVYHQDVRLATGPQLTPLFDVPGHESNLQIEARNRSGESFYVHYALVNQASGRSRAFGRSVARVDEAVVPSVAPGAYALRMESEPPGAQFDLTVRRNVPSLAFFWIVVVMLLIPPLAQMLRRSSFERARWQGSSR